MPIPSVHKLKTATGEPAVVKAIQLRIPDHVRIPLVKAAENNLRSLNNEIVWRLMESLKETEG